MPEQFYFRHDAKTHPQFEVYIKAKEVKVDV